MALKPCRECKKKVSTEAVTCPNCGVPNPTQKKIVVVKKKINPWGKDKTTRDQSWRKNLGIENLDDEKAKNKLTKFISTKSSIFIYYPIKNLSFIQDIRPKRKFLIT